MLSQWEQERRDRSCSRPLLQATYTRICRHHTSQAAHHGRLLPASRVTRGGASSILRVSKGDYMCRHFGGDEEDERGVILAG